MDSNIEKWLTNRCKNNELYAEDKEKLMEMYKNIPKYKFSDIFNKDPNFYKINNIPCIRTKCIDNRTSLCSKSCILISRGIIKHENNIYKVLILEKDYIFKDVYCIQFLTEIYFHKLAFNNNNNNNVIIPEIQDYGELIDMEDNKTIYFYKIPYYEKKLNTDIDIICRLENNNIVSSFPQIIKSMEKILLQYEKVQPITKIEENDDETKKIEDELKKMGYL